MYYLKPFTMFFAKTHLLKIAKKKRSEKNKEHKKVLLQIAKRKGSFKEKRKNLKQSGGFLGTLLGI